MQRCGCSPWNYPFAPDRQNDAGLCDYYGKYCFEYHLQNQDAVDEAECPPDCEMLTYSFMEKEWALDAEVVCKPGGTIYAYLNAKVNKWAHTPLFR